ncbi:hypothetical protein IMSAGC001_03497 [Bacteroides acidifaciens]|uniref:Uncharacterized protein n=1 Tax=Bacteroides acidifaciens TaxID=85831 RepID=A0A7J0A7F4_9BACE|nr:hypothetical protein IMSAGC001_03497 [Bacteroides acidifaciens]
MASDHPRSHGHRTSANEGDRRAEDKARFGRAQGEHRPLDGGHPDVQFVGICQELRTRHSLDGRFPRHVALAHAGYVERHAHQQPHARHDRLFHHTVLFHRPGVAASRHFIGKRDGRRHRRARQTRHNAPRGRGLQRSVRAGHRFVQDV